MVVLKFGGTSVAGAEPIARAAAIVARTPGPRVVVVSALAGVTDRLLQIVRLAEAGRVGPACLMLDRAAARHRDLARTLAGDGAADVLEFIDRTHETLRALVQAAAGLRDASP
ncbi:MAG: bifunctional aspartate kinase/homoserine dehydrogenase I, partial [Vicinamibacterales bacterium]